MSKEISRSIQNPEEWKNLKNILVILAHPDDPEFFCGATIARWTALGHLVSYCLLTKGQRGTQDSEVDPINVGELRVQEQLCAAKVLGVDNVHFLDHMDGDLVPSLVLRNEIISVIRETKPDIVVTCDPTNFFPAENRINHPDHRSAGQVVLDAVFPAVANPGYRLEKEGIRLPAHKVEEIWLSLTHQPNLAINVTSTLDRKIDALLCHRSQVGHKEDDLRKMIQSRFEEDADSGETAYFEKFRRIKLIQ